MIDPFVQRDIVLEEMRKIIGKRTNFLLLKPNANLFTRSFVGILDVEKL